MKAHKKRPAEIGFACLDCGQRTRVINTRGKDEGCTIMRRRKCGACGFRFTTYEQAHEAIPFTDGEAVRMFTRLSDMAESMKTAIKDFLTQDQ